MKVTDTTLDPRQWDLFVQDNYPPVGAFMQAWGWGAFQKDLGRRVGRYSVMDGDNLVAVFTLVELKLAFGFAYGYVPRGPVVRGNIDAKKIAEVFQTVGVWVRKQFPHLIFVRLEPPVTFSPEFRLPGFHFPSHYVQPRHNIVVDLTKSEEDILASFHSSTRSNTRRAEKRGVTVTVKDAATPADYQIFTDMVNDTIRRNNGKNAYPHDEYFHFLLKKIPLTMFLGYCEDRPASIHFVLFFGKTATYLYGASHTAEMNSKADTYCHWYAMKEAKRRGCKYYDLGAIDSRRWPSLTTYKRQFKGQELEYMGNIDIPFRTIFYYAYSCMRYLKTRFK